MKDKSDNTGIPIEIIGQKIFVIRGKRVLIDRDLAALYGVETKVLNQAVKRNSRRFPDDFMYQLTREEFRDIKSQFVTYKYGRKRSLPYAFTEQGVAMLSSVLKSDRAVEVNIQVMRAFVTMREFLATNKELAAMVKENREAILQIIKTIDALKREEEKPKRRIGLH